MTTRVLAPLRFIRRLIARRPYASLAEAREAAAAFEMRRLRYPYLGPG